MALSRRAKITAGAFGLAASALFAASGSAVAADGDNGGTELVIVEQAQGTQADQQAVQAPGDCAHSESTTSTVADTR